MKHSESITAKVRLQIREYLKSRKGEWVRQREIVEELLPDNIYRAKRGVFNGIFFKMRKTGWNEPYKPIPNVEVKKVDGGVFYRFVEPTLKFPKDSQLGQLASQILEFEQVLKENQAFTLDIRQLDSAELSAYVAFKEEFERLKDIFFHPDENK